MKRLFKLLSLVAAAGMLSACTVTIIDRTSQPSSNESQTSENSSITSEAGSEPTSQSSEGGSSTQSDTESTTGSQETTPSQDTEESTTPQPSESESESTATSVPDEDFTTTGNEYRLVTNLDTQLHIGYRYVIGSVKDGAGYFMSNIAADNYRPQTAGTVENSTLTLSNSMLNLELCENSEGDYMFKALNYGSGTEDLYITSGTTENQLFLKTETALAAMSITLGDDGRAIITSIDDSVTKDTLRYNSGTNGRFNFYAAKTSTNADNQSNVYLFRGSETSGIENPVIKDISIKGELTKTEYTPGETISTAGLYVEASYTDTSIPNEVLTDAVIEADPVKAPSTLGEYEVLFTCTYGTSQFDSVRKNITIKSNAVNENVTTYSFFTSATQKLNNGSDTVILSGVSWDTEVSNAQNTYNSANYCGQQMGTKDKKASLHLTSKYKWGEELSASDYYTKVVVREVRLWLNTGGVELSTIAVTVGGVNVTGQGSVTKNTTASSYTDTSLVKFTSSEPNNTGKVDIQISTEGNSSAWYFSGFEIDCEKVTIDPSDTLDSISIKSNPTKTDYYTIDENWDTDGSVVEATYESGKTIEVIPDSWTFDPETVPSTAQNLTVEMTAHYGNKTDSINLSVSVTVKPDKFFELKTSFTSGKKYVLGAMDGEDFYRLAVPTATVNKNPAATLTSDVEELTENDAWLVTINNTNQITISYTKGTSTYYLVASNDTAQAISIVDAAPSGYWTLDETGLTYSVSTTRYLALYNDADFRFYATGPTVLYAKTFYEYLG